MTPGGNVATGQLECWLTMEFKNMPDGDARDIRVHFSSEALQDDAEFDWSYIAAKDVIKGENFGDGNRKNEATTPESEPPLGQPLKVKFPLAAKRRLPNSSGESARRWPGSPRPSGSDSAFAHPGRRHWRLPRSWDCCCSLGSPGCGATRSARG